MGILLATLLLTAEPQKIAVMDLRARDGISPGLVQIVTDAVVAQVRKRAHGATVIGSEDLRNLLGFEKEKRQVGCQEMACLAEIGGALGAEQLVVGTLAKLAKSYILDLRLIDSRHAKVLLEDTERLKGVEEDALLDAAAHAVAVLFPDAPTLVPSPAVSASPEVATDGGPSHPRPLAWVFGGVGIATGGLAVVGLVEMLSFKGWQAQPPNTAIPNATMLTNVNTANTWATIALVSGIAAAAGLTGAAIAW